MACCTLPIAEPNYTVCFPDSQRIPGNPVDVANPYYDHAAKKSYWTYSIQIDDDPPGQPGTISNLSHWDIQMCPDLTCRKNAADFVVEYSANGADYNPIVSPIGNIEPMCDNPGDKSINDPAYPNGVPYVLKIDMGQDKGTTVFYRITIVNSDYYDLTVEPGLIALKQGSKPDPGYEIFTAPGCTLPTPSINCHQPILSVTKTCPTPPVGEFFIPGGPAPVINITVKNTGSADAINVTVIDQIDIPAGVTVSAITPAPGASVSGTAPYVGPTTVTVTWTGISVPANGSTPLQVALTISEAPQTLTNIINANVGIGTLPVEPQYRCDIPVKTPPTPPPGRGVDFRLLGLED